MSALAALFTMRILLATLSCLLICCCLLFLSECGPGPLAESDTSTQARSPSEQPRPKAKLSAPEALSIRESLAVVASATRAKVTKSGRRKSKPRGCLQIQIVQPVIPRPKDTYALRVFSLDGKTTIASRIFTQRSFEIDVPVGRYRLIVCDADYPWSWIPNPEPEVTAGPKQLFLHEEAIRISVGANTIVAVDPSQGGRFWFHAIGMPPGGNTVQALVDEARIGTKARGRGCGSMPNAGVALVLREYTTGKEVPLAWASTDVLGETGPLKSDRGYLMQDVLPAGEYEISLNYALHFFGKGEQERKVRFWISDGETSAVVVSLHDR